MLVKGDKNISFQIQNKCMKILNKEDYSVDEFRLIYDYRSKIIHGDYKRTMNKLRELSNLEQYKLTKNEMQSENYLTFEQMLEDKIRKRLFYVLRLLLKLFIFKNDYIRELKYIKL